MAFDGDGVLRILLQPLRLLLESGAGFRRQVGAVGREVDDVADIDAEITLRSGRHRAVAAGELRTRRILVVGAGGDQGTHEQDGEEARCAGEPGMSWP